MPGRTKATGTLDAWQLAEGITDILKPSMPNGATLGTDGPETNEHMRKSTMSV